MILISRPRMVKSAAVLFHQRMARHQLIGMLPSRQRLDALHEGADRRIVLGDVEAEFVCRVIEVGDERDVRDGWPRAEEEGGACEPLVDDREIVAEAALQERLRAGIARERKIPQETVRSEKAVDLLV